MLLKVFCLPLWKQIGRKFEMHAMNYNIITINSLLIINELLICIHLYSFHFISCSVYDFHPTLHTRFFCKLVRFADCLNYSKIHFLQSKFLWCVIVDLICSIDLAVSCVGAMFGWNNRSQNNSFDIKYCKVLAAS